MKTRIKNFLFFLLIAVASQGCIAFPPLIQVEHKESPENKELLRRLDAIDRRLDSLEKSNANTK